MENGWIRKGMVILLFLIFVVTLPLQLIWFSLKDGIPEACCMLKDLFSYHTTDALKEAWMGTPVYIENLKKNNYE